MNNQIHFLKNVTIMGGLLILAANGPGGASVGAPLAQILIEHRREALSGLSLSPKFASER